MTLHEISGYESGSTAAYVYVVRNSDGAELGTLPANYTQADSRMS